MIHQIGKNVFLTGKDCLQLLEAKKIDFNRDALQNAHDFLKTETGNNKEIYGLNTQFGDQVKLTDTFINAKAKSAYLNSIMQRQLYLIRSHAAGLGSIVEPQIVKLAILLRAHCLTQGYSGVRPELIDKMLEWATSDYTPVVYQYGSIGASGDLIPLATIAAALIGEKVPVWYKDKIISREEVPIEPIRPELREGLALINGTSFMTAIATLSFVRLQKLFQQMLYIIGMVLDTLKTNPEAYNILVHQVKHHPGSIAIANILKPFFEKRYDHPEGRLQDYYSLRSVCQGFGPFYENLQYCEKLLHNEINSVNDNPMIDTVNNHILHEANFMGYYITNVCDILKMDIAQASTWLHALLANLYHPRKNKGLPTNLIKNPQKNNGFRPLQLLAAALAVENRKNALSHQAYMLPTEGDNQDVNSLGTHAAFDFMKVVDNLERLCAIAYLSGAQAAEFRNLHTLSTYSQKLHSLIRTTTDERREDEMFHDELEKVIDLLRSSDFNTLTNFESEGVASKNKKRKKYQAIVTLNEAAKNFNPQQIPIILVHPGQGNISLYENLVAKLPSNLPIFGIDSYNFYKTRPITSLNKLATYYVKELHKAIPTERYILGGWSLGGCLAFEMAQQMANSLDRVELLIMLDSFTTSEVPDEMIQSYFNLAHRAQTKIYQTQGLEPSEIKKRIDLLELENQMIHNFKPAPYHGKTLFINATKTDSYTPIFKAFPYLEPYFTDLKGTLNGWQPYLPKAHHYEINVDHDGLIKDTGLIQTSSILNKTLNKVLYKMTTTQGLRTKWVQSSLE